MQLLWVQVTLVTVFCVLAGGNKFQCPEEYEHEIFCTTKPEFYDGIQQDIDEKFRPIKELLRLGKSRPKPEENEYYNPRTKCHHVTDTITPYTMKTENTTNIIVQASYYKQYVNIKKCQSEDDTRSGEACVIPYSYTLIGQCRTRYAQVNVFVYYIDKKRIKNVNVTLPVSCTCVTS